MHVSVCACACGCVRGVVDKKIFFNYQKKKDTKQQSYVNDVAGYMLSCGNEKKSRMKKHFDMLACTDLSHQNKAKLS